MMNMMAGLIGFGGFFIALVLIGVLGYWKADDLEAWAKKHLSRSENNHG
ncbi:MULTISPECIES: hypothetical protein [Marinobacter]|nr:MULTISPECIES: hypothetical protein [Marinobacter]MBL3556406.1 hypothetical protein [Marinobacter sp. JB05H06]